MPRCLALIAILFGASQIYGADRLPSEKEIAAQVDQLLLEHLSAGKTTPAPLTNDEDFLRRVSLDLAGQLPTPGEATSFGLDPDPAKRAQVIDSLLSSPDFGEVWASYWKDVIYLRATEARSRISQPAFEKWMMEQLNANRPWNEVTRELITATGNVRDDGRTGLIFAHNGEPEELAAEISRIFLGIQISCANCHNHPTDSWKREQFHGLAAYLPRVTVRRDNAQDLRSFVVTSFAGGVGPGGKGGPLNPDRVFKLMDLNRDGKVAKSEARGPLEKQFDLIASRFDENKDGMLNKEELAEARATGNEQPGRGASEYYMPDLQNPSSMGTLTQPEFFLKGVKGPSLKSGADDQTRRNALADYVTSSSDAWFAIAFVNRIWAELLGEGFYMPIDDLGPERTARDADVLKLLAKNFTASGYDVKRLYRTVTLTQAYQRQLTSLNLNSESPPFSAATSTRLRSDQIYNSILQVLGVSQGMLPTGRDRGMKMLADLGLDPRKAAFSTLFGYDPSTPQEDLLGNVPQALFMMNSPQLETQIRGTGFTRLAQILRQLPKDEDALEELYVLVLSRAPTEKEREINQRYLKEVGNRQEAFEDIMWSLMNSAEFLSKR